MRMTTSSINKALPGGPVKFPITSNFSSPPLKSKEKVTEKVYTEKFAQILNWLPLRALSYCIASEREAESPEDTFSVSPLAHNT